jgi:hypothetical protein|tara:strand:+ start:8145 stop:8519 length:375 start_codon:yes stop_codon:yes gene_type:complete
MALIKTGTERLADGRLQRLYEVHKFASMGDNTFTDALEFSGAKSIWVMSTGASVVFLIPPVGATGEALTVTGDYQSMGAGSVSGSFLAPTGSATGFILGDAIPPYLCIRNNSGGSADVTVFVTY